MSVAGLVCIMVYVWALSLWWRYEGGNRLLLGELLAPLASHLSVDSLQRAYVPLSSLGCGRWWGCVWLEACSVRDLGTRKKSGDGLCVVSPYLLFDGEEVGFNVECSF